MKTFYVLLKSLKEQIRSYWVLILTLSMGPFFILVYFLITETSKPQYKILVINNDAGIVMEDRDINHGNLLVEALCLSGTDPASVPFLPEVINDKEKGIEKLKNKKADAVIVIGTSFSKALTRTKSIEDTTETDVEFIGDLTNTNYLISAVWANEIINNYALQATGDKKLLDVKETGLGISGNVDYFDMVTPGILMVSLIMLMFTASIAFVTEVENKTIIRLKLSKLKAFEFLSGITIVQLLVGIISVLLSLMTALLLGFHYTGSLLIMILIAGLTSLSIIAFSLIIAGLTKSANEVLVVGNFPMFLFMFFTGAAFPLKNDALFTIAGYPINIQGLMTPTHAVSALNKTLVMDMSLSSIIPEIIAIATLTVVYFLIGAFVFKHRHLKLT